MFDSTLIPLAEALGVPLGWNLYNSDQIKLVIALYSSILFGILFRCIKGKFLRYIIGLVLGVALQLFLYGERFPFNNSEIWALFVQGLVVYFITIFFRKKAGVIVFVESIVFLSYFHISRQIYSLPLPLFRI